MTKNQILAPAFFLMVLTSFSCNQTQQSDAGGKTAVTIIAENTASIQSLMTLKPAYEKLHPNVQLNFKPNSFDDAFNKVNQDFANGTAIYDIIMQYNFSLSSFVNNNYVYNIDELTGKFPADKKAFEKDLFPKPWKEVGFFQKSAKDSMIKVGYPFAANTAILMFNKEMFEDPAQKAAYQKSFHRELTVPANWNDFVQVANFFNQPKQGLKGVCLQGTGAFLYAEFMNFVFGKGGATSQKQFGWQQDKSIKVTVATPEFVSALKLYKQLKPANAGNWSSVDQFEQMRIMKEGKTAMALVWSDMIYPTLIAQDNGAPIKRFGFTPAPGDKSLLAGGAFFINKKSKSSQEAANFIMYVMQPQIQIELARHGLSSPLRTAYDDPQVKQLPYTAAVKASLERGGIFLEAGPDANMISDKIVTYVQRFWNDQLSAEAATQSMQHEIEAERAKIYSAIK